MRLAPYKPKTDLISKFLDEDDFFFGLPVLPMERGVEAGKWFPALDMVEEKDQYVFKADLPGMKKEDIKIALENGVLSIEGERKSETEHKDRNVCRCERTYGRFIRAINVGTGIDQNKIKANYKDGVLEVIVPKSETAKPKAIDIQVD